MGHTYSAQPKANPKAKAATKIAKGSKSQTVPPVTEHAALPVPVYHDRTQNGWSHSISSHSIRKAAISMALASGVSAQNIRRWTRWHQAEMVWHYAQADYVVQDHWKSFFAWMKALPAQTA